MIGRVVAPAYTWEVQRRNRRFDRGVGVARLDRPVISVGNLSLGGTGKTPMVHRIVRTLQAGGHSPCIAMRGYRAKPGEIGDEENEHRRSVPGVPVVAQPDRLKGLHALFASGAGRPIDSVVLDDGFQHRRIARDLDIVLLDATRSVFADRCFPAGWLREPISSLRRAHAIVLTHAERVGPDVLSTMAEAARSAAPDALVATAEHRWVSIASVHDDRWEQHPVEWLRGKRVAVCCGIGHPDAFLAQVASAAGVQPVHTLILPDHGAYTASRIARVRAIADAADLLVTTAKDWSKLRVSTVMADVPIAIPQLEIALTSRADEFDAAVLAAAKRGVTPS